MGGPPATASQILRIIHAIIIGTFKGDVEPTRRKISTNVPTVINGNASRNKNYFQYEHRGLSRSVLLLSPYSLVSLLLQTSSHVFPLIV